MDAITPADPVLVRRAAERIHRFDIGAVAVRSRGKFPRRGHGSIASTAHPSDIIAAGRGTAQHAFGLGAEPPKDGVVRAVLTGPDFGPSQPGPPLLLPAQVSVRKRHEAPLERAAPVLQPHRLFEGA